MLRVADVVGASWVDLSGWWGERIGWSSLIWTVAWSSWVSLVVVDVVSAVGIVVVVGQQSMKRSVAWS